MSLYDKYVDGTQYYIHIEDLPIDTPNILGQRYCDDKEISSALATPYCGFNRGLYRPVFGIGIKEETGKKGTKRADCYRRS